MPEDAAIGNMTESSDESEVGQRSTELSGTSQIPLKKHTAEARTDPEKVLVRKSKRKKKTH